MKHKPRDYQEEDVQAILRAFEEYNSALYVAATGLGKTFVMGEVVERRLPGRALLLAHRSELIWQARNAFLRRGIEVEIEKGELVACTNLFSRAPVVLATVQTLTSGSVDKKRMHRFNPKDFSTLLYDEAHHGVSVGNKSIVDYFVNGNPELKVLGVTATPDRADEEALGQIFQTVAAERDILFGVENGWLIEPEQLMVHVGGLDFSQMRSTAGDLNGADLAAAMEAESAIQGVAQPTLEVMFGCDPNFLLDVPQDQWASTLMARQDPRRTIVFTVSVAQAEMLSNIFNRVIPGISSWVCGKTSEDDRRRIFEDFDYGKTSILVNCGVTTEGYDNPAVELIVVARPTESRSLYAQMIGRGTRPLPGVVDGLDDAEARLTAISCSAKPRLTVLDFVGNSGKHKLVTTADILGGNVSDEAVARAAEIVKKSKVAMSMKQVLEDEENKIIEEAKRRRAEEEAKKAKLVARVRSSQTKVSPFDLFDLHAAKSKGWDAGKQLSEKQRGMLMKQGIDPDSMTYAESMALINEMFRRWNGKLATVKQCSLLKKNYPQLNVKNLTMARAGEMITELKNNNWRPNEKTAKEILEAIRG